MKRSFQHCEFKVFGCAVDNFVWLQIILTSRICVTLHVACSVPCFTLTWSGLCSVACLCFLHLPSSFFDSVLSEYFKGVVVTATEPFLYPSDSCLFTADCWVSSHSSSHCASAATMSWCWWFAVVFFLFLIFLCFLLTCERLTSSKTPTLGCLLHFAVLCLKCFVFINHLPLCKWRALKWGDSTKLTVEDVKASFCSGSICGITYAKSCNKLHFNCLV